jgi:hypothetical protein
MCRLAWNVGGVGSDVHELRYRPEPNLRTVALVHSDFPNALYNSQYIAFSYVSFHLLVRQFAYCRIRHKVPMRKFNFKRIKSRNMTFRSRSRKHKTNAIRCWLLHHCILVSRLAEFWFIASVARYIFSSPLDLLTPAVFAGGTVKHSCSLNDSSPAPPVVSRLQLVCICSQALLVPPLGVTCTSAVIPRTAYRVCFSVCRLL